MRRTVIVDGHRYCNVCEYLKTVDEFYRNGAGNPQDRCKKCDRVKALARYHVAMRRRGGPRLKYAAQARARYWAQDRQLTHAVVLLAYARASEWVRRSAPEATPSALPYRSDE